MKNLKDKTAVIAGVACIAAWLLGSAIAFGADPLEGGSKECVYIDALTQGDVLVLQTADRTYTLQVVDKKQAIANAEISADGVHFSRVGQVRLLGATHGLQEGGLTLVEMGAVRVGMKLEFDTGDFLPAGRMQTGVISHITVQH